MGQSGIGGQFSVQVDQLVTFAEALGTDGTAFGDAIVAIMTGMANLPVNFMGGGLAEGRDFGDIYFSCFDALAAFQVDVAGGLATLAGGAALASTAYADGDASSSEVVAAVTDAFRPPPAAAPLSPEDIRRWLAAVREGEEQAQDRWDENRERFDDIVDRNRDVVAGRVGSPDGDHGGAEMFSSDYHDDRGYPHRDTAGSAGGFITVANDDEHVSDVPLMEPGDHPGGNAISDRELGTMPSWDAPDDVWFDLQDVGPLPQPNDE
jgi:hypothetical protein